MAGPTGEVFEWSSLLKMSQDRTPAFLDSAQMRFGNPRALNLDSVQHDDMWVQCLAMYYATGDRKYLDEARRKADEYIGQRIATPVRQFSGLCAVGPVLDGHDPAVDAAFGIVRGHRRKEISRRRGRGRETVCNGVLDVSRRAEGRRDVANQRQKDVANGPGDGAGMASIADRIDSRGHQHFHAEPSHILGAFRALHAADDALYGGRLSFGPSDAGR